MAGLFTRIRQKYEEVQKEADEIKSAVKERQQSLRTANVGPAASGVPLDQHRRIVDQALLARDQLWLKKLQGAEMQIMLPFQGPLTRLIRATEREIAEKEHKLESE